MNDKALQHEGKAKSTTMTEDIHALHLWPEGLMAGLGIQGNKITKITPE